MSKTGKWFSQNEDNIFMGMMLDEDYEVYKNQLKEKTMVDVVLEWKPLSTTAKAPAKAHSWDAAYDLYADCPETTIIIAAGKTQIVPTNVAILCPRGWSADIRGRSGMNSKGRLAVLGLVDADYTGMWGVVLYNSTSEDIIITHHDRIAQFTVNPVYSSELVQVEDFKLDQNARASSGFGSTGR
jgi:dUTP pyrophosphatase